MAGLYGLLKLLEFSFFGFYTSRAIRNQKDVKALIIMLSLGVLFESLLAALQFLKQSSLGGVFYFFGERTFTSQTPGIANASIEGKLILRPYGTFSHPNVLAGYLIIALAMVISNIKYQKANIMKIFFLSSIAIGSIALLLTMSRTAIILWIAILFYLLKPLTLNTKYLILFLVCIGSIFFSPFGSRFFNAAQTDESFIRRKELTITALEMIKSSPIIGVGLMNFLPNLPLFQETSASSLFTQLQPVHNIFLLVFAETGIIGLSFFLWFLKKTFKRFTIFSIVLILGFFDHYFLTLQQGQLLFSFVFGYCWTRSFELHSI
ncbi:MAG: O-antigen ligase family protein [Candidatus Levybacteria bacterium]|nr:O-antigen ligase family protein [Candidatus Levybacteria bacterium]